MSERVPEEADPVIRAYIDGVDRTLLAKNAKLSVEERFVQLMELQRLAEELRAAAPHDTACSCSTPGRSALRL